jgi:hypothetical protein
MGIDAAYGIGSLKQGVCTSSTRPASPFEGQMIYETDTDMVAVWNGTAWRYIAATTPTSGTVLQVVQGTTSTLVSSTSATYIDSGLTATLTPKSSSSKILVSVAQHLYCDASNTEANVRIVRDTNTVIRTHTTAFFSSAGLITGTFSTFILDNPGTTAAMNYKTQFSRQSGTGTVYGAGVNGWVSAIILQEIAG